MPASSPEEIHALIGAAFNAGDLDAFIDLHEPDASSIVPPGGDLARGTDEIRTALEPIFAVGPKIEIEVVGKLEGDGLALTHARLALEDSTRTARPSSSAARSSPAGSRTGPG